ncbi:MAG: HI0074 family nucleotidyltransferase substrate-binding subunit [Pseudobdellovibrionaceae bacterium]
MDELINFEKTLKQLKSFVSLPIQNDRDKAGIIQAFEYTFEQCWKSIQKKAGHEGVQIASPKRAFMFAFQNGWIKNEAEGTWLQMIEDRNLTSHTYKEDVAKEILNRIIGKYISCFDGLLGHLKTLD